MCPENRLLCEEIEFFTLPLYPASVFSLLSYSAMAKTSHLSSQTRGNLPYFLALLATALMAFVLNAEGRVWWCKWGDRSIYINQAWGSSHTSQHLFDPYTFTHVVHGILFFWLTGLIFRNLSGGWRFFIAIVVEAGWEIVENSSYVIRQYRENTASLDYFGDSVANSIGDVIACAAGFWIAVRIGWRRSVFLFILIEVGLLFWIRDSLLLNVVMLLYPLDWVKAWQSSI